MAMQLASRPHPHSLPLTSIVVAAVVSIIVQLGPGVFSAFATQTQQAPRASLSSAFTYQGRVTDGGVPLEGAHDFVFSLFAEPSGGAPLGPAITANDLQVNNGQFSAALDFGDQFGGEARWLDVTVDGTPVGRQELTATPYALYAKASDWNALQNRPADFADGVDNDTKDWNALQNVPLGFQDGVDDGESYVIGSGLELAGANLSVKFAGSGSAATAARSDHNHFGASWSGEASFGLELLNLQNDATALIASTTTGTGIRASSNSGVGLRANTGSCTNPTAAIAAIIGCTDEDGPAIIGQLGGCPFIPDSGVVGCSNSEVGVTGSSLQTYGVWGDSPTVGVYGSTLTGTGVSGLSLDGNGVEGESVNGGIGVVGRSVAPGWGVLGILGSCGPLPEEAAVGGCSNDGGPGVYGVRGSCVDPLTDNAAIIGCTGTNRAIFGQTGECTSPLESGVVQGCTEDTDLAGVAGFSSISNGVHGSSDTNHGVVAVSGGGGTGGSALFAEAIGGAGVAIYAKNNSGTGTTVVAEQNGTGDIFRGFSPGLVFQVQEDGDVRADGTFATPAADLAERFETLDSIVPGTVVAIDPVTGAFVPSTSANSAHVVGVVSTKPGVVLGVGIEGVVSGSLIALAGRVPVFVTNENGTILPGDLLVSSSTPGRAMKAPANPAAGTVIGKAVGFVDPASGMVTMLVMNR